MLRSASDRAPSNGEYTATLNRLSKPAGRGLIDNSLRGRYGGIDVVPPAAGEVVVGSFIGGAIDGAWTYIEDAWNDMVSWWDLVKAIYNGDLFDQLSKLVDTLTQMTIQELKELARSLFGGLVTRIDQIIAAMPGVAWEAAGWVVGFLGMLALHNILGGGSGLLAKIGGKLGKLFGALQESWKNTALYKKVNKGSSSGEHGPAAKKQRLHSSKHAPSFTLTEVNDITAGKTTESLRYWAQSQKKWTDFKDGGAKSFYFDDDTLKEMAKRRYATTPECKDMLGKGYTIDEVKLTTTPREIKYSQGEYKGLTNKTPKVTNVEFVFGKE